jgi:hypothetical protein
MQRSCNYGTATVVKADAGSSLTTRWPYGGAVTFSEGDDDGDAVEAGDLDRPAPAGPGRRRSGCLLPIVVFLICASVGFVVAASVRGNDDDGEKVTLEEGDHGGDSYRIEGVIDEQGARCIQLLRDGELNTGACDTTANEARVGDMSVIFGKVPAGTVSVRMPLSTGDRQSADVQEKDGFRWYSLAVDQDVDMGGEPTFVNADGGSN